MSTAPSLPPPRRASIASPPPSPEARKCTCVVSQTFSNLYVPNGVFISSWMPVHTWIHSGGATERAMPGNADWERDASGESHWTDGACLPERCARAPRPRVRARLRSRRARALPATPDGSYALAARPRAHRRTQTAPARPRWQACTMSSSPDTAAWRRHGRRALGCTTCAR